MKIPSFCLVDKDYDSFLICASKMRESHTTTPPLPPLASIVWSLLLPRVYRVRFLHSFEFPSLWMFWPIGERGRRGPLFNAWEREAESSVARPHVGFLAVRAKRKESHLFASQYVFALLPLQVIVGGKKDTMILPSVLMDCVIYSYYHQKGV